MTAKKLIQDMRTYREARSGSRTRRKQLADLLRKMRKRGGTTRYHAHQVRRYVGPDPTAARRRRLLK